MSAIPEVDELLIDSATRLFSDTCSFDAVQAAEAQQWAPSIWQAVAEAGFAWIGLAEEAGGSGGSLADACEVLRIAGSFAAPVPLAETAMLGGWLLTEAGIELPEGSVTLVPGITGDSMTTSLNADGSALLSGTAKRVPWASAADRIAVVVTDDEGQPVAVAAIAPTESGLSIDQSVNLAGEPRQSVVFDGVTVGSDQVGPVGAEVGDELRLRGALSRTMLSAGALEAMSKLTVEYTEQRHQFGRPVGRFQAVQQHLVWGAQDAAIAKMAAQLAARAASFDVVGARFEIAAARCVAEGAASSATRGAHQAHGAMGMTQEYALHHLSRRLWAWRHEWAVPGEWPAEVGRLVEAAGADELYPLIAS
ncbi:MAG: acyl-CoA dehydrogenase [Actinomycetia bacterium]|nr:acyl-CoA dehydrogenase [Actinomycetes bacterium]